MLVAGAISIPIGSEWGFSPVDQRRSMIPLRPDISTSRTSWHGSRAQPANSGKHEDYRPSGSLKTGGGFARLSGGPPHHRLTCRPRQSRSS